MNILKWTVLMILLVNVLTCAGASDAAKPSENWILVDVVIKKDGGKTTAQFMFYSDISERVNGKEIKGFGKSPVMVNEPKINGAAMKEVENENKNVPKLYLAEIDSAAKDYTITFSRKDGEYQALIHIDPNDLSKPLQAEFARKKATKK